MHSSLAPDSRPSHSLLLGHNHARQPPTPCPPLGSSDAVLCRVQRWGVDAGRRIPGTLDPRPYTPDPLDPRPRILDPKRYTRHRAPHILRTLSTPNHAHPTLHISHPTPYTFSTTHPTPLHRTTHHTPHTPGPYVRSAFHARRAADVASGVPGPDRAVSFGEVLFPRRDKLGACLSVLLHSEPYDAALSMWGAVWPEEVRCRSCAEGRGCAVWCRACVDATCASLRASPM
eukprot:1137763-Rhodomonas_salina.1